MLPLCPGDVRVAAWVKPLASLMPTVSVQHGWEPVIFRGGRPRELARGIMRDWIAVSPPQHKRLAGGLIGMKPQAFCFWVFEMLGAQPDDELADLFAGSGAVADAWRAFTRQSQLGYEKLDVERLPFGEALATV